MNYLTEFKIQQLRTRNLIAAIESIAMVTGAVIANMLIPQLLLNYVYTDTSMLTEAPAVFTYLPLVTYGIALAYFVYAMVTNFLRARQANTLEQELLLTDDCCGGSCGCGDCGDCGDNCESCDHSQDSEMSEAELLELEKIVDQALKPKKTAKTAKKKTSKKTK